MSNATLYIAVIYDKLRKGCLRCHLLHRNVFKWQVWRLIELSPHVSVWNISRISRSHWETPSIWMKSFKLRRVLCNYDLRNVLFKGWLTMISSWSAVSLWCWHLNWSHLCLSLITELSACVPSHNGAGAFSAKPSTYPLFQQNCSLSKTCGLITATLYA